jgi:sporulation protein YlmC with PRC-barrel domain
MTKEHPNALILSSRVKGSTVFNTEGERIGHIEDLSIDKQTGQVRYALMSFGGFLGLGDKLHPLPWNVMTFDLGKGGYVVPVAKEQLKEAPSYAPSHLESFGGEDFEYREMVYRFYEPYGALRYW